ncbi:hypothetical protein [Nocardioides halotolerans]|uniref:hypothetical protein n=1 Tax=Nocardioides halotolerans TaxID=433660 RepID=UPI0003F6E04B|nr:hypothetical protein [Nocardioides halotolerans]
MTDARTAPGLQRLVALALLLVAGILSLPLAAAAFDGEGSENWILPTQLAGTAVLGALVGYLLPGLAGDAAPRRRAVWVGVGVGLLFAVVGVLLFFVLLNGFDG